MRKIIFTITISLFSLASFAQTSLEEYNYVTKGYKVQIESGLDMKKGYELVSLGQEISGERKVEVKKLNRTENKTIAAYLIIYQRKGAPDEYICVPNPNSDKNILTSFSNQLYPGNSDASERLRIILFALSKYLVW